jgi:hypothetical protein
MSRTLIRWFFSILIIARSVGAADRIEIEGTGGGEVQLKVPGEPQERFRVESVGSLGSTNWQTVVDFSLTNSLQGWKDGANGMAQKFYRYQKRDPGEAMIAPDFRLIDHLGVSRGLYYYSTDTNVKAFVLVFTANGCSDVKDHWTELERLRQAYGGDGVKFWMIDSNPADTRSSIAAEAKTLGVTWPIMHDRAQSVGRAYGIAHTPEVVCVERESYTIFYKGAARDSRISKTNVIYLEQALAQFKNQEAPTLHEVQGNGCELNLPPVAIADYATEIAPMFQQKCVTCHSPGNVAPWAMTNYAIVKDYAGSIREEVLARRMPPWHADPEYGVFTNDRSLSIEQEKKLLAWIDAGSPRGSGADPLENVPPPPPKWPPQLGEPDLVIKCPPQTISATGVEPYRYIYVASGITSNVSLRASIVRPSNRQVVHHYLVWLGANSQQQASGIAGYTPGDDSGIFPAGTGVTVPANSMLTFNLHYTPSGAEAVDEPELGLWFHKTPPAKEFQTIPLVNQDFTIPAGASDHEVTFSLTIPTFYPPITVYSFRPHMHLRGSRMRFEIKPLGSTQREILCSVPNYTFHWQTTYQLVQPRVIMPGTTVYVTGAFDNSAQNEENPDPTQPVKWGEQSWEEMFIGYIEGTY